MTDEQMTSEEVTRLQQLLDEHSRSGGQYILLPSVFLGMMGIGALIAPLALGELVTAVLFWPAAAGTFWFAWLGFRMSEKHSTTETNLKHDLKNRVKEVVEGPIHGKNEKHGKYSAHYHFVVHDEEHAVDLTSYTRFDVGDHVRLSLSKKARAVVGVEHGESPADTSQPTASASPPPTAASD